MIDYSPLSTYGELHLEVSLKECTTLKIGGVADAMLYVFNVTSLISAHEYLLANHIPYKVFGKGSNLLCSDERYSGCILRLDRSVHHHYVLQNQAVWVEAGCSTVYLAFALAQCGLSGFEWASGIPATVGGAIANNAGAYNQNMLNHIESLLVSTPEGMRTLLPHECEFSYRHSIFKDKPDWIILAAKLKFDKGVKDDILKLISHRQQKRMESQPLNYPSAGSTFRNFEDVSAWQCIEELGFQGKRIGDAQVSLKHSNFLVNLSDATASNMLELIHSIQDEVYQKSGRKLVLEVELFNWDQMKKTQ